MIKDPVKGGDKGGVEGGDKGEDKGVAKGAGKDGVKFKSRWISAKFMLPENTPVTPNDRC